MFNKEDLILLSKSKLADIIIMREKHIEQLHTLLDKCDVVLTETPKKMDNLKRRLQ